MKLVRTYFDKWKITVPATGALLLGAAWLAFGYFGIHTAFIDDKVEEAAPVFDAAPAVVVADTTADNTADTASTDSAPAATPAPVTDTTGDEATTSADDTAPAESDAIAETAPADDPVEAAPAEQAAPEVVTEASGQFTGTSRYDVSGDAIVLGNGTGQRFLRFENFESNNGPDLNVYLINPDDPSDFIDLGDLKGNIGDQNYEIPVDVDLDRYSQVSIWCVRFSVGFGFADLT